MQGAIAAVAERARWEEWQRITAPTLLVRGQNGTVAAAEVEQMVALRPGVQHLVISDAGHDVHLEQPAAWVHALTALLPTP
jgi:pimeloyl-ACP methyl ester carboxylesterase